MSEWVTEGGKERGGGEEKKINMGVTEGRINNATSLQVLRCRAQVGGFKQQTLTWWVVLMDASLVVLLVVN